MGHDQLDEEECPLLAEQDRGCSHGRGHVSASSRNFKTQWERFRQPSVRRGLFFFVFLFISIWFSKAIDV